MARAIRRFVTGHNERGESICVIDGPAPVVLETDKRPGAALTGLWETREMPADCTRQSDAYDHPFNLEPPINGTQFVILELQPENADVLRRVDRAAAFGSMNAAHALAAGEKARHPYMHKTETVDYVVVLSGEVHLILDKSEHLLKAGDVVIQNGTNHAWSNRGKQPCIIVGVLIDARRR